MGKILGVSLATMAAASVALPAYSAELSDYNNEVKRELESAATANLFLEQTPRIRSDISRFIVELETEYETELGKVPSGCRLEVIKEEPVSIDELNYASTCNYDETQTKIASNILESIEKKKDNLEAYIGDSSNNSLSSLEEDIEDAQSVISDANQSFLIDLFDDTIGKTVSVSIDEDGNLNKTYYGDGREVSFASFLGYGLLATVASLAGLTIGMSIGNTDRRYRSLSGPSEPDALS